MAGSGRGLSTARRGPDARGAPLRRPLTARGLAAAVAALVLGAFPAPGGTVPLDVVLGLLTGTGHSVRITRTEHGVAHIEAADEEALAYGIGYAHAQDNACATAELLVTLRGERSRWFGAESSGELGLRTLPNRVIDLFVRSHMDDPKIAFAWRSASPQAHARARGVVAGFNRYLEDTGTRLPPECAGKPWVQPMTEAEFGRLGELMVTETGVTAWADAVVAAQPPRRDGTPTRPAWLPAPPVDDAPASPGALHLDGSNALAFGRDSSLDGRGLLLANPHFPWRGMNRFWQAHLTIPGQLDVMGATLGTLPWVTIGFNRSVAWSHTVSPGRHFTLHELALVPGNPTAYLIDGKPEAMRARGVRVSERGPDGQMSTSQLTLYSSRYGPIVVVPTRGLLWTPAVAYALQDVNAFTAQYVDAWRAIDSASSTDQLRAALALQGTPWMNTVAVDRDGGVLFADASSVPDVGAARLLGCGPSRAAARIGRESNLVVLDGARSACDWTRDPTAAVSGAVPPSRMPALMREDWVQNASDGYWLANPAAPLTDYSPLIGTAGTPLRLATRAELREIAARLEGRDGRAEHRRMGPDDLSALLFSNRNLAASLVLDDLLAACRDAPSAATRAGCAVLAKWDRTDDAGSRGAQVFREFWRRARVLPGLWRVPFDRSDPVYTPAGLNILGRSADPVLRNAVFDALGQGVHAILEAGFTIDEPLGRLQTHPTPAGPVELSGGEAFEGVLNALGATGITPLTRAGYDIDEGTSYLQLVGFDATGPTARALLVYGQSSRPGSPFSFDQLPAYAAKRWYELPFDAADVAAHRIGAPLTLRFRGQATPAAAAPEARPGPTPQPPAPTPAAPAIPAPGPPADAASDVLHNRRAWL